MTNQMNKVAQLTERIELAILEYLFSKETYFNKITSQGSRTAVRYCAVAMPGVTLPHKVLLRLWAICVVHHAEDLSTT